MLKYLFNEVEEGKNAAATCKNEALNIKVIGFSWQLRFAAKVLVVFNITPRLLLP